MNPKTFSKLATGVAAVCMALLGFSSEARAQTGYFYLDRAQISGAPDDGFMVWRPHAFEVTRFYGFTALGYTLNPLRAETVSDNGDATVGMDTPVQGQLIQYLHVGTEVAGRLGLNVSLPVMWFKDAGEDPQARGIGQGGIGDYPIAIHDVRFDARLLAFESDNRKWRLGLGGALWAPTGNAIAFTSDDSLTGYGYGAAEVDFGKFFLAGNLGAQLRPERTIGGSQGTLGTDTELRFAFGGYLPIRSDKYRVGVELWGTTGLAPAPGDKTTFFASSNTDIEWLAQGRMFIDQKKQIWAMGGAGTRLYTGYGAPDVRVLISIGAFTTLTDMEPDSPPPVIRVVPDVDDYDRDTDKDGYPDSVDKCVNDPEDGKKPNPTDGCPAAADRDNDGIPDSSDECPDVAEDKDGVEDKDGCPENDADSDQNPRRAGQVPDRTRSALQDRRKERLPLDQDGRRGDRDPRAHRIRVRQGGHQARELPNPRRGREGHEVAEQDAHRRVRPHRQSRRHGAQHAPQQGARARRHELPLEARHRGEPTRVGRLRPEQADCRQRYGPRTRAKPPRRIQDPFGVAGRRPGACLRKTRYFE